MQNVSYPILSWNLPLHVLIFIAGRWVHEAYQFHGNTFFVNCQVRKPEVGIWLWYFGTGLDAKKFRVKITLGNPKESVRL
jgi:hypothetical protein